MFKTGVPEPMSLVRIPPMYLSISQFHMLGGYYTKRAAQSQGLFAENAENRIQEAEELLTTGIFFGREAHYGSGKDAEFGRREAL